MRKQSPSRGEPRYWGRPQFARRRWHWWDTTAWDAITVAGAAAVNGACFPFWCTLRPLIGEVTGYLDKTTQHSRHRQFARQFAARRRLAGSCGCAHFPRFLVRSARASSALWLSRPSFSTRPLNLCAAAPPSASGSGVLSFCFFPPPRGALFSRESSMRMQHHARAMR